MLVEFSTRELLWTIRPILHLHAEWIRRGRLRSAGTIRSRLVFAGRLIALGLRSHGIDRLFIRGGVAVLDEGGTTSRYADVLVRRLRASPVPNHRVNIFEIIAFCRLLWSLRKNAEFQIASEGVYTRWDTALSGARYLFRAQLALSKSQPKVIVVFSQHSAASRAYLASAKKYAVHSVYIPHAPIGCNPQYSDLPVDYAYLRGRAELRFYESLAGESPRMIVTGEPTLPTRAVECGDGKGVSRPIVGVLYAASPVSKDLIVQDLIAIKASVARGLKLVIALHARQRSEEWKQFFARQHGWVVLESTPTREVLRSAAYITVHRCSGVGLEALYYGSPSIAIAMEDQAPNYLYLRCEPGCSTVVRNVAELRQRLRHVSEAQLALSESQRWIAVGGNAALSMILENINELQNTSVDARSTQWLLDSWA